jgi:Pyridine nucleotide-disulphide oxidoreductase
MIVNMYTILTGNLSDHLISSPLALASGDFTPKAWVKFDELPALHASNIFHIQGTVANVDCERKIAVISHTNTGRQYEESYDYLIAASGLRRAWPTVPQSLQREKYLEEAGDHIEKLKKTKEGVVVIGGGMYALLLSDCRVNLLTMNCRSCRC